MLAWCTSATGLIGPGAADERLLQGTGLAALVVKPAVVGGFEAAMRITRWAHSRRTQVTLALTNHLRHHAPQGVWFILAPELPTGRTSGKHPACSRKLGCPGAFGTAPAWQ